MGFVNNIERYGFLKSDWPLVDIMNNSNGSAVIYMGKTKTLTGRTDEKVWLVKKISIHPTPVGETIVTEITPSWDNAWSDREKLKYQFI